MARHGFRGDLLNHLVDGLKFQATWPTYYRHVSGRLCSMKKTTGLIGLTCIAVVTTCLGGETSTSDLNDKKIKLITDTAATICASFSDKGESSELTVAGGVNAQLSKLSRALADLGLNLKADYDTQQHQGVLKDQVLDAIKESNSCRLDVFHSLLNDTNQSRTRAKQPPTTSNNQTTHGNGSHNIQNVSGGVVNINAK